MDKISYDDFSKLDLRIAKIESTENIPGKTRIIKGIISLGEEKRDVIIGGANFYEPSELVGRLADKPKPIGPTYKYKRIKNIWIKIKRKSGYWF